MIHQAGPGYEVITVEMDFEHVRRVRERGLQGLCQTLKSFRDHPIDFPPYRDAQADPGAFGKLGVLAVPGKEPLACASAAHPQENPRPAQTIGRE